MNKSKNERVDCSGNILRTMLVLFLGVFLMDVNTDSLNWYWTIGMALAIVVVFFLKRTSSLLQADDSEVSGTDSGVQKNVVPQGYASQAHKSL